MRHGAGHIGIPGSYDPIIGGGGVGGAAGSNPRTILGADLELWLRSDFGVTTVDGAVSQWDDISGNGRHVSQSDPTRRPIYNASDANWGGKPSITFDGSNDMLVSTAAASVWKFLHDGTGGFALAVYLGNSPPDTLQHLLATGAGTATQVGARLIGGITSSANARASIASAAAYLVNQNVAEQNNVPTALAFAYEEGRAGNEIAIWRDGASVFTGNSAAAPSAADPFSTLHVGATSGGAPHNGEIVEVIVASIYPSAGQLTAIDAYMAARWGI